MSSQLTFKEKQWQMREDAILDATREILSSKGIMALTMDEVAAKVGIAKGSLYQHFPSKEELLTVALLRLMRIMEDFMISLPATEPAISKLRQILRWALIARFTEGYPDILSVKSTMQDYLSKNPEFTKQAKRLDDLLLDLVEQAKKDGAIDKTLPTKIVVYTISGRIRDSHYDDLVKTKDYTAQELADLLVEMVFRGTSPTK